MALSSVSVVANALLLRRWAPAPAAATPEAATVSASEPFSTTGTSMSHPTGEHSMYELTVEGMSCNHCVGRVTKSVQAVDADAKVAIDLDKASVRIDSHADLDRIVAAIDGAGYPVTARAPA